VVTIVVDGEYSLTMNWAVSDGNLVLSNPRDYDEELEDLVEALFGEDGDDLTLAGGEEGVVFNLATNAIIQGMELAEGLTGDELFGGTLLTNAGGRPWNTIAGPGAQAVAIQFTTDADWGQGLDLRYADFGFQVGDRLIITGTVANIGGGRLQVNRNVGAEDAIYGTTQTANGPFTIDHVLTDTDVAGAAGGNPAGLRIELRATGATAVFHNIRVERD